MADQIDEEESKFTSDEIVKKGDYIRSKILDNMEVKASNTAPTLFTHNMKRNNFGLNDISNVDMGYACTTVSDDGIHISKRVPYLNELEYNVKLMKDSDNAVLVLNGGLFSYVPKSRNGKMLSYKEQVAYFYSLFKDLAKEGKILALVRGTEEHRILKNHQIDVMGILQDALGLDQRVCNDAFINVALEDDMVGNAEVGIRTINWNNTATTRAYLGRRMEDRASKRGGADIYLARSTMNFYKKSVIGETINGEKINKPVHMISSGGYTPFKGALTAGAEYNSIRDNELTPSSFWYKVSVEKNENAENGERPYTVVVDPVQYVAHQITTQGTDTLTASIQNKVNGVFDGFIQRLVDKYPETMANMRSDGYKEIREVLLNNKQVAERNKLIKEYKEYLLAQKKAKEQQAQEEDQPEM